MILEYMLPSEWRAGNRKIVSGHCGIAVREARRKAGKDLDSPDELGSGLAGGLGGCDRGAFGLVDLGVTHY
jgi:hypothetical protein